MKYYKIKDIKPPCLVTFEKHNGRGRLITHRIIFVRSIEKYNDKYYISYDTYTGSGFESLNENEMKICSIYKLGVEGNESIFRILKKN